MNRHSKAFEITITGLMIAIVCVATMFLKIDIPLGYANLGTAVFMLIIFFIGGRTGIIAAAVGSALSDLLLGYAVWIVPTLLIKAIMGLIFVLFLMMKSSGGKNKALSIRTFLGAVLLNLFGAFGYTLVGIVIYGWAGGIASAYGLLFEGGVNVIVFFVVAIILEKSGIMKSINNM